MWVALGLSVGFMVMLYVLATVRILPRNYFSLIPLIAVGWRRKGR